MKKLLLFVTAMLSFIVMLAQRTLSGIVKDDKGIAVAGATVQVKGTRTGTTTRGDGSFSLEVPSTARTIVISYVGFADQDITIGSQPRIDVSLVPNTNS